jgi:hypothetical protein
MTFPVSKHSTRPTRLKSLPTTFLEVPHQDLACIPSFHSPMLFASPVRDAVDSTSEPHAEVDANTVVDHRIHNFVVFSKVKVGQET